jgi:hypothetical protein
MVRMIIISVVLLGMVLFFIFRWQAMVARTQPPLVTRVDIYSDRLTYRNGNYTTTSNLAIALQANNAAPEIVEVRDCAAVARLGDVLEVVRRYGAVDFQIVLPENC